MQCSHRSCLVAGMDQLIGKVEVPGNYSPYQPGGEGFDMVG